GAPLTRLPVHAERRIGPLPNTKERPLHGEIAQRSLQIFDFPRQVLHRTQQRNLLRCGGAAPQALLGIAALALEPTNHELVHAAPRLLAPAEIARRRQRELARERRGFGILRKALAPLPQPARPRRARGI